MDFSTGARRLNRAFFILIAFSAVCALMLHGQSRGVHTSGIGIEVGGEKGLLNIDLNAQPQSSAPASSAPASGESTSGSTQT
ncbi:MAG: hypothetical protein ACRDKI_09400, partial [Solirubrobacterales bacterium]